MTTAPMATIVGIVPAVKPAGYAAVNPFIITANANDVLRFVCQVFGGEERMEVRTVDDDGQLVHSEVVLGDTTIVFADRKPGWPFTPSLLQVWVDDVDATLDTARELGAIVVSEPTDFYGDTFSRFLDPWRNLWWVYRHDESVPTVPKRQPAEITAFSKAMLTSLDPLSDGA